MDVLTMHEQLVEDYRAFTSGFVDVRAERIAEHAVAQLDCGIPWLSELDAAHLHLCGVERDDVDHILDTFPVVQRKDEPRCGEYRTKRLIFEINDATAKAIETGEPYHAVLDTPPGQGVRHRVFRAGRAS